ncbi:EcsC family protein [Tepidibacter hydrothermalis]|uniref:EcsC family protein n=1 Tax=Tepidibacter hydrothermalis TaxID=3036126 RepID=A0ABY8EHH0_9FIRM|nr:EcsC family protein [Tepidibacter hydrothermalis]WFD12363.1 EcsC family protein [Tepidibacter hydrothermalis]
MDFYNEIARKELNNWKKKMRKKPSLVEKASKHVQNKFNNLLPEKYHEIVTSTIKNMTRAVLFGSKYITKKPYENLSLRQREKLVAQKTKAYKTTALIEGAGTGAGGIILGLADLPLLLSIKIKLLYDIAAIYGFDVNDYKERIYILNIFHITFASKSKINDVFYKMENFEEYFDSLPDDIDSFDWRSFQQEYRDYIDLAKLLQMVPGIGAFVGAYVNSKLIDKLSKTAVQAYRMRIFP